MEDKSEREESKLSPSLRLLLLGANWGKVCFPELAGDGMPDGIKQ